MNDTALDRVVDAIVDLGLNSFVLLDKAEPEFRTFTSLLSHEIQFPLVALLGVCVGLVDYRLGQGGASKLWNDVEAIAFDQKVTTIDDVRRCVEFILQRPVSSGYKDQKTSRINRFFSSEVPMVITGRLESILNDPTMLWNMIADSVGSAPEKKTIAFAMKAFDLAVYAAHHRYLRFEREPPIPVDYHVRRITEIIGLLPNGSPDDHVRHTWFQVSMNASRKTGESISPLRIDSLVWQSGVRLYDPQAKRHSKSRLGILEQHLKTVGIAEHDLMKFLNLLRSGRFDS